MSSSTSKKAPRGSCICRALRTFLLVQFCTGLVLGVITFFLVYPPADLYYSPLNIKYPYASLPTWGVQEIYHDPIAHAATFSQHQDRIVDWSEPPPSMWAWNLGEKIVHLLEVTLPARLVPPPAHLFGMLQGPGKLQVLRSIVLLGVPDLLKNKVLSLRDLHAALKDPKHQAAQAVVLRSGLLLKDSKEPLPSFNDLPLAKLERIMSYALSIGYFEEVGYRGSHIYVHNAQSVILRTDHPNNLNHVLFHFSNEAYLVWHNLFHSLLTPDSVDNIDSLDVVQDENSVAVLVLDPLAGTDSQEVWNPTLTKKKDGQPSKYTGPHTVDYAARVRARETETQIARAKKRQEKILQLRQQLASGPSTSPSSSVGSTAWEKTLGSPLWTFFAAHPALEANFAGSMSQVDGLTNEALVADFEWAKLELPKDGESSKSSIVPVSSLIDVGGAQGAFLQKVLERHPSIKHATLFDLPGSIQQAKVMWDKNGQGPYALTAKQVDVSFIAGDFFQPSTLPKPSAHGATRYILGQILHDWTDREAMLILRNLREVAGTRKDVSVTLIELNKSPGETNFVRHFIDFQMLVCCNAKERTVQQWELLFEVTGWRMTQYVRTRSMFHMMELLPIEHGAAASAATGNNQEQNASKQQQQQPAASRQAPKQEL